MLRWQQIKRFFKCSDPNTEEEEMQKGNRLVKVQAFFDAFIQACKTFYLAAQCIALDEAIKAFRGRCLFKQYIKSKPVKWGIKIFCVCCSITCYLLNAEFFLGKMSDNEEKKAEDSKTHTMIMRLLKPFRGRNHILHCDNWFTSVKLFQALKEWGIFGCGTIRTNRKDLCDAVKMKKGEESELKKTPGIIRYASIGILCLLSWFDKRAVHILTNAYMPSGDLVVGHWYKALPGDAEAVRGKVKKSISIPPAVKFYRAFMGGVDLFDQYRAYYKLQLRSFKYWHVMFFCILEAALVNAWVVYSQTRKMAQLPLEYNHFEFRASIAKKFAEQWLNNGISSTPLKKSPLKHFKVALKASQHLIADSGHETRFSCPKKHLQHRVRTPSTVSGKIVKRQLLCAQCYCSRPIMMCSACSVPLCIPECYHNYHTSDPEHHVQVQQKKKKTNERRSLKSFTQHETANLSTTSS